MVVHMGIIQGDDPESITEMKNGKPPFLNVFFFSPLILLSNLSRGGSCEGLPLLFPWNNSMALF